MAPPTAQRIADRYEVERLVGSGGMARVYRARDSVLERVVALKILHEQYATDEAFVRRFRDEARAAARLSHPNVVRVLDRGVAAGREYIVFEYVEGESLRELVARSGALPLRRALELGLDVARALTYAHERELVHRDVKPQNVLVGDDGRARVADFGIARSLREPGHTESGAVLGTGSSISPEQARGERVGPAADVYALGVLLYELLAGEPPYDGETLVVVALRHVEDPVPAVLERRPDCPPRLARLVDRCLAKAPEERPTAGQAARELQACLDELLPVRDEDATVVLGPPASAPARRAARRRRGPLALVALALLAALVAAGLVLRGGGAGGGNGGGERKPVAVTAVASYDPEGDGRERPDLVPLATDGDPATSWSTEGYSDFAALKSGVGLVLDAGSEVALTELTVTTDLPGFTAEVRAGDSPDAFSEVAGRQQTVERTTMFVLDGRPARYYLLWITSVVDDGDRTRARVGEVRARS